MRNAMEEGAKAKRDSIAYFKKNGTLKGYKGAEVRRKKSTEVFLKKKITQTSLTRSSRKCSPTLQMTPMPTMQSSK